MIVFSEKNTRKKTIRVVHQSPRKLTEHGYIEDVNVTEA